jgi:hypothetical protein
MVLEEPQISNLAELLLDSILGHLKSNLDGHPNIESSDISARFDIGASKIKSR